MLAVEPVILDGHGVLIEPLSTAHMDGLRAAVSDGELWRIRVTSAPHPDQIAAYVADATSQAGRVPFVITDTTTSCRWSHRSHLGRAQSRQDCGHTHAVTGLGHA